MSEQNGPSAEERERVDRYLAWRQGHPRIRTAHRRRRWTRAAIAALLGVALIAFVAVVTWLVTAHDPRRISVVESEPPRASPPVTSSDLERPAVQKAAPRPLREATRPREAPKNVKPAPQLPESSDASPASAGPGLPIDSPPPSNRPQVAAIEPAPSAPEPPPVTTHPPPASTEPPPVEPTPGLIAEPTPEPASTPEAARRTPCEVARRPRADAGERRGPAVADCVGGWLKGEAQEFRDGVKRGIGEFRSGFERLRREIRELGEKVSP